MIVLLLELRLVLRCEAEVQPGGVMQVMKARGREIGALQIHEPVPPNAGPSASCVRVNSHQVAAR